MKVGIVTFEQFNGRTGVGSSRIRGHWLEKYWDEAEIFVQGKKYDAIIYQKAYWNEHASIFDGKKILDICDPDFLHWGYRTKQMIDEVDAVTTSTEALAEAFRNFTDKPVVCIPDRIDLSEIKSTKKHKGDTKWVAWYGYSSNFDMLKPVIPVLHKMGLGLIVISDSAFFVPSLYKDIPLRNLKHSWRTVYQDLLDADVVINPQSTRGRWKFKSNNKTIMAWALGLPVAHTVDELKNLLTEEQRIAESKKRLQEVAEQWDIKLSVDEYKKLLSSL